MILRCVLNVHDVRKEAEASNKQHVFRKLGGLLQQTPVDNLSTEYVRNSTEHCKSQV